MANLNINIYRAPRALGPEEGRKAAKQGDQLAQGPRHLQPGGTEEGSILHADPGQV